MQYHNEEQQHGLTKRTQWEGVKCPYCDKGFRHWQTIEDRFIHKSVCGTGVSEWKIKRELHSLWKLYKGGFMDKGQYWDKRRAIMKGLRR